MRLPPTLAVAALVAVAGAAPKPTDRVDELGKAWLDHGRTAEDLTDLIDAARASGRWERAAPFLTRALAELDEDVPRSVQVAELAATALGDAQLGLDALVKVARREPTKKAISAVIAAIRSLGKFERDKAKAIPTLVAIVDVAPPQHPDHAPADQRRALAEPYTLHLAATGAAVNALAELRAPGAVKSLVFAMYRTPALLVQIRRALVAAGPTAEARLRAVLAGRDAEIDKVFAREHLDRVCADGPNKPCESISARDFYAAVVVGDFYDPASVGALVGALARPPLPQYYAEGEASPNTQYNAIFDALRKIGAPEAAAKVRELWMRDGDVVTRTLAVEAYAWVARDQVGLDELVAIAGDDGANDQLRQEAASAYARLATDLSRAQPLELLARRYLDASAQKRREADGAPKARADAADKQLAAAKQAAAAASGPDRKRAEEALKTARKAHKEATSEYRLLDLAAKDYRNYARMFQGHVARIAVAARCKQDLACYAATLARSDDEAFADVRASLADADRFTADDKTELRAAEIDRAMLELGKRGAAAATYAPKLLDALDTKHRLVAQSILFALGKIAKPPCDACRDKLAAAIASANSIASLADLRLEMSILRARY